jgi:glutamate synthase domain-containing protein 2
MSIGGINVTTARILGIGAAGLCYINSGEGGFGTHSEAGADTILQIGTAKIGMARYASSHSTRLTLLDEDKLLDLIARHPQIKLIQLKISQGAKPGAVMLPGRKLSPVVALIRGHTPGQQHISPLNHCEIEAATATESMGKLLGFITRIRSLTGLPVGIKLSMGSPAELADFTRLMAECDQYPDQITLDGADGGTSAAHDLIANYMGYGSVHSAVYCVDKLLKDHGLRQKVVVSASGKLYTPIRALQAFALGAQSIETARGFLIALGCNQCRQCHTEHCPYSLTSSEAPAYSELQERELAKRVSNYVRGFNDDIDSLTRICGLDSPLNVTVDHFRGPFLKNIVNEIEEILR